LLAKAVTPHAGKNLLVFERGENLLQKGILDFAFINPMVAYSFGKIYANTLGR